MCKLKKRNNLNRARKSKDKLINEKTFNIIIHKGNGSQNNIEIPCHPSQNGYHQGDNSNAGNVCGVGWGGSSSNILLVGM
jgi:hypothetical protein